jgi:hypothetical protein
VTEAHSPWAADMLHGRFLSGLAARAVEQEDHDPALRLARLTVDMFRSPPMTPFIVRTSVIRDGRRVRVLEVSIRCGEVEVARASALLLRTAEHPTASVWRAPAWDAPPPDAFPPPPDEAEGEIGGWDIRLMTPGGFWTADRKRLWTRDRWQLVAGEELSPVVRAALAADLPNPLANSGAEGLQFINPDLTLFLARPPTSEWIGLEVTDHIGFDGIAVGSCTLYDETGRIGASTVCAITNTATLSG